MRIKTLLQALLFRRSAEHDAILTVPDVNAGIANLVTDSHYIILKVLKWDSLRITETSYTYDDSYHYCCIVRLQGARTSQELPDARLDSLPWDRNCMFELLFESDSWPGFSTVDRIPFSHVVSLFRQWLCTKLMVLKSGFATWLWEHISESEARKTNREGIKLEAQAITENMCGR
ncbi:hypothetical protein DPSP01_001539 [Paraphaeosphaeria sporulosa]